MGGKQRNVQPGRENACQRELGMVASACGMPAAGNTFAHLNRTEFGSIALHTARTGKGSSAGVGTVPSVYGIRMRVRRCERFKRVRRKSLAWRTAPTA